MKKWNVVINGITHTVEYKYGFEKKIIIDGEVHSIATQNLFVCLIDYPFIIDGTELRIVVIGNKIQLVVNGVYEESGESYVPLNNVPPISNLFTVISCILGFIAWGGVGLLIGIIFSQIYVKKGVAGKTGAVVGAFIGFIISIFALGFFYAFLLFWLE